MLTATVYGEPADITRRDWLMMLIDAPGEPIDRIRIQKALFLFSQRSKAPQEQKYSFKPYHYGPFSQAIYEDLDDLEREGMIRSELGPGNAVSYALTASGATRIAGRRWRLPVEQIRFLQALRDWVIRRSFRQLLSDIYRLYPEYAVNSIFR